ncbi:hypothetical protein [Aquimarina agarivorans]|uniref:hypothetical protein n=1 Tax=Aquimarina agarivorans TaxID=980584 RepID=UPI000248E915|nr:hypothetical protein [Aquimarina agarivorans]
MKLTLKMLAVASISLISTTITAQEEEQEASNIQTFTPSKLLRKGQWDIKFFNSIYTQTKQTDAGSKKVDIPRQTFFTNTTEIFTGVSESSRINVGFIFQVRSNALNGQSALDVFSFEDNGNDRRSGLSTIAPSIRVQPFRNIGNFSFTSSFFIPVFEDKADTVPTDDVFSFLDQRSFAWDTKFFYDRTFGANKWQLFTELDFKFNFGESSADAATDPDKNQSERFANNSLFLPASIFLSYFPTSKSTVFINAQQSFLIDLGNEFAQNGTQLGIGAKYQVTRVINLEGSYGRFVRGENFQGLGNTFSVGLRALF